MDAIVLDDPDDVTAALEHPALEPPRISGAGATLALRAAMARFSPAADHAERRAAVVAAIAAFRVDEATAVAADHTRALLDGSPLDVMTAIARRVPTETLVSLLDARRPGSNVDVGVDAIVRDVETVVRVIGRGEAATAASDAATERLHARFGDHRLGWVPVASMLYQGFDATMWLIGVTLHATATGEAPAAAVPRTRRVARRDAIVGAIAVRLGTEVAIEIGAADLPYGAGPHACPGSELAEAIVAGVVAAIAAAGYAVDLPGVVVDADGRPTRLPITRSV